MKVKKIRVAIQGLDDTLKEAGKIYEQASAGKAVKQKSAIYFSSIKEMRRVLTEKRLALIKTIKDKKPSSLYDLAKLVHRDLKNVLQDITYLQALGIVDVADRGDKKVPRVTFDMLSFEVAL